MPRPNLNVASYDSDGEVAEIGPRPKKSIGKQTKAQSKSKRKVPPKQQAARVSSEESEFDSDFDIPKTQGNFDDIAKMLEEESGLREKRTNAQARKTPEVDSVHVLPLTPSKESRCGPCRIVACSADEVTLEWESAMKWKPGEKRSKWIGKRKGQTLRFVLPRDEFEALRRSSGTVRKEKVSVIPRLDVEHEISHHLCSQICLISYPAYLLESTTSQALKGQQRLQGIFEDVRSGIVSAFGQFTLSRKTSIHPVFAFHRQHPNISMTDFRRSLHYPASLAMLMDEEASGIVQDLHGAQVDGGANAKLQINMMLLLALVAEDIDEEVSPDLLDDLLIAGQIAFPPSPIEEVYSALKDVIAMDADLAGDPLQVDSWVAAPVYSEPYALFERLSHSPKPPTKKTKDGSRFSSESIDGDDLLCPYCDEEILPTHRRSHRLKRLLRNLAKLSKPSPRPGNPNGRDVDLSQAIALCSRHREESSVIPAGLARGWPPTIEWNKIESRLRSASTLDTINSIVAGTSKLDSGSPRGRFWQEAVESIAAGEGKRLVDRKL